MPFRKPKKREKPRNIHRNIPRIDLSDIIYLFLLIYTLFTFGWKIKLYENKSSTTVYNGPRQNNENKQIDG